MTAPALDNAMLAVLTGDAEALGLLRLGVVDLAHPGFEVARRRLRTFLAEGHAGEMVFLKRAQALRERPEGLLDGARSILVALVPCRGRKGAIARYAQSADYHSVMTQRLLDLAAILEDRIPGAKTRVCVDTKPLLERSVAMLGGLGFIGKHGGLIAPGLGSQVLLGEILCTAPWEGKDLAPPKIARAVLGQGAPWDACGECVACLEACPTQAFVGPGDLDPRRCISYLTLEYRGQIEDELAVKLGARVAGCDVCQDVCPHNQSDARELRVAPAAWLPPPPGPARVADLARLANIGSNQYRGFVRHTALTRVPRRAMRRNALLALGNDVGPISELERETLARAMDDAEPEIRRVARWAARRRGTLGGVEEHDVE